MRKALTVTLIAGALVTGAASADAHMPATDGGRADRGCVPVLRASYYVGASGGVTCGLARRVAAKAIRGGQTRGWRCTYAAGRGFGHCHRRGRIVHWAVND